MKLNNMSNSRVLSEIEITYNCNTESGAWLKLCGKYQLLVVIVKKKQSF